MDDDVIGSEPERAPRPRRLVRAVPLPARLRRHGRVVAVLAVLIAVAGVVAVSRAGVSGLQGAAPPTPTPSPRPPLRGEVLGLAAGQDTVYAIASDCAHGCRPTLVASADDGFSWSALALPGAPVVAPVDRSWTLSVSGVEDLLAIERPGSDVVLVGNRNTPLQARKIVAGDPVPRVPTERESMTRICAKPRCPTPILEYLEPRTGRRGPLVTQPPVPPRVLAVGGSQLWVAGIDPRTRHWALAVSVDDGASWTALPLPQASTDPTLVPRLVPVPDLTEAYFLQGYPNGDDLQTSYGIWEVPGAPGGAVEPPRLIRPEGGIDSVEGAVGLRDGRLVITAGVTAVLSPDGVVKRPVPSDVESERYLLRQPMRGPHGLVIAEAVRTDGAASIAISATGNSDDWDLRPIAL